MKNIFENANLSEKESDFITQCRLYSNETFAAGPNSLEALDLCMKLDLEAIYFDPDFNDPADSLYSYADCHTKDEILSRYADIERIYGLFEKYGLEDVPEFCNSIMYGTVNSTNKKFDLLRLEENENELIHAILECKI